jgi:iron(III) transport system permease protein
VLTGAGGALGSVALGLYFARAFAFHSWRGQRLQRLLILLPYLLPNFILAIAWVIAWNPASGLLQRLLPFPAGLYGRFGMAALFALVHLPVAMLLLEEKLRRLDRSLVEAARLSGARAGQVFWRIELGLVRPTLIAALGLCFALNISAFAIPAWIGAPARVYPLTYKVYQAIQVGGAEGIPGAAVYAFVLFALAVPILVATARAQGNERRYAVVSGKAARQGHQGAGGLGFGIFQAVFWATFLATFAAPMLCLFASTLTEPGCLQDRGVACLAEPTLRAYRYVLFDLAETRAALWGSAFWGTLSALLVVAIAVGLLVLLSRAPRALQAVEWVFLLLTATPGAILALGLIVVASGRFGVNLYNTPWIVVAALVLKHQSLGFQPLRTGVSNVSASLLEAARLSGASTRQVWSGVVLPILRPELVGGFFLVLVPALGELTMSVFLQSPSFRSLGTVLFDLQDYADSASAGALSMLLLLAILAANEAGRVLSGGRAGY